MRRDFDMFAPGTKFLLHETGDPCAPWSLSMNADENPHLCHLWGSGNNGAAGQQGAGATQVKSGGQGQMSPNDANMYARNLITRGSANQPPAITMLQPIFTATYTSGVNTTVTVPVRPVGLIKRFWVKVTGTITAGAQNLSLTALGLANFWSSVVLTDFMNNQRIQTTGAHLNLISSAKRRRVFGAAMTTDTPNGFGNIFTATEQAPATINATLTGNFQHFLEVPCAYSDHDLRGAVWGNTVNAAAQLQLTVGTGVLVATGADPTLAVYQSAGAAAGTLTTFTVTVYQEYFDQIPSDRNRKPILPLIDLSYAYTLINTTMAGVPVVNTDNAYAYPNFRQFLSTAVVYDNGGTLNIGTDITNFQLQSANFTNIFKLDPITAALRARLILGDDCPKAMYYFDHRDRPIDTQQYGNITLTINPSTVNANASVLVWLEALAVMNLITQAGSYGQGV
jgi:hypothetical protein